LVAFIQPSRSQNVKYFNKHAVLDLIRFTPGGISRVELAQKLSLTRAAVTSIVNDLMEADLIHEVESRVASSGRPPILLSVNADRGLVAGIDMGATHLTIILANVSGQVIAEKEVPFDIAQGPEACLSQADSLLKELLAGVQRGLGDLSAVGVGVPGPIVSEAGMVLAPPIMPGWDRFPIRDSLQERWGHPVSLNNDAELGALGEWAYGAERGAGNLAYIKIGTGVGAGLLIGGQIYRGATGSSGEIGHLTIEENGPLCNCGNRGCLETLTGGHAIARIAREMVGNNARTILADIRPAERITAIDVANAARQGDPVAQQIIVNAGDHLGIAIAGLVNLFNPDSIVVGGGVAQIGDLFLEPVRKAVQKRSLPAAAQAVRITTALLGRRSSGMGAVVQAASTALHQIAETGKS
jgi:glucokinase-like ROK family protein